MPEPDRLVFLWTRNDQGVRQRMTPGSLSDLRSLDDVFSSVAGFQGSSAALSVGESTEFVRGGAVTTNYFRTLGINPMIGRDFLPEEGAVDGPLSSSWGRPCGTGLSGATPRSSARPFS
jgi:hypothetical protein